VSVCLPPLSPWGRGETERTESLGLCMRGVLIPGSTAGEALVEEVFLQALHDNPTDDLTRQALADWLEEQGDPRGEILRLYLLLQQQPDASQRQEQEEQLRELLASGVRPCVPLITNSIGMQFALVPPGSFTMGSPASEEGRGEDEEQKPVEIAEAFYLGIHPVTQQQYQRVMGTNPSLFAPSRVYRDQVKGLDTSNFPVENVSWEDAVAFATRLSELAEEKRLGRMYRLPSEAQWEYACRGGPVATPAPFHVGPSLTSHQANFRGDYPYGTDIRGPYLDRPTDVGSYAANCLGLYDMHGNVWEWCQDWYVEGSERVWRGGGWNSSGSSCRSAMRLWARPYIGSPLLGFRLAQCPSGR
jgi:uncharacterized protein (TIGR02996 family)